MCTYVRCLYSTCTGNAVGCITNIYITIIFSVFHYWHVLPHYCHWSAYIKCAFPTHSRLHIYVVTWAYFPYYWTLVWVVERASDIETDWFLYCSSGYSFEHSGGPLTNPSPKIGRCNTTKYRSNKTVKCNTTPHYCTVIIHKMFPHHLM